MSALALGLEFGIKPTRCNHKLMILIKVKTRISVPFMYKKVSIVRPVNAFYNLSWPYI